MLSVFQCQTLFFDDGERNKSVVVTIFDDDIPEGDEKFQLILTNPSLGLELGENTTGKTFDVHILWNCMAVVLISFF